MDFTISLSALLILLVLKFVFRYFDLTQQGIVLNISFIGPKKLTRVKS